MAKRLSSTRAEMERYRRKEKKGFFNLLLFYILPFIIVNGIIFVLATARPSLTMKVADTKDYLTTEATITVTSVFPIRSLTIGMDGEMMDLGPEKKKTYTVPITKNGVLEAEVVNFNGMTAAAFEHINVLDENPPFFENAGIQDGIVTLTVADSQSGINFESVYAVNSEGNPVKPIEADQATNTFSFLMDPAGLHVHAQDRAGNEVQGTFTSHKEGSTESLESTETGNEAAGE